jgi:peptidoglycan/LPS O-acetylase OafA/YrhL
MTALTSYFYLQGYADLPWEDPNSSHRWLYRNPLCRLGDFLLGMLAARLLVYRDAIPQRLVRWGGVLSAATILGLLCWPAHVYTAASWDISYALPATALIFCLAAAPSSAGSRWLSTKPLLLLGEASYALYLCHVNMLNRMSLGKLPPEAWPLTQALTILLVVVIAIGLHVAIERPARELLRGWFDPVARAAARNQRWAFLARNSS